MLAAHGVTLTPDCRILDFCCGAGDYVKAFASAGYDIQGFEPYGDLAPVSHEFSSLGWHYPYRHIQESDVISGLPDLSVDWRRFRLPYPDAMFDFVFSTEVMEHISDHDSVLRELRRVMKPDGTAIHSFPARYRLIEPHILIPLGGIIKAGWWYHFWSRLGVNVPNFTGSPFQSPKNLVRLALWYARGSLHYPPPRKLRALGRRYFKISRFEPALWKPENRPGWLYTRTGHVIWYLAEPRAHPL